MALCKAGVVLMCATPRDDAHLRVMPPKLEGHVILQNPFPRSFTSRIHRYSHQKAAFAISRLTRSTDPRFIHIWCSAAFLESHDERVRESEKRQGPRWIRRGSPRHRLRNAVAVPGAPSPGTPVWGGKRFLVWNAVTCCNKCLSILKKCLQSLQFTIVSYRHRGTLSFALCQLFQLPQCSVLWNPIQLDSKQYIILLRRWSSKKLQVWRYTVYSSTACQSCTNLSNWALTGSWW